jgi:hypothetical protein
MLSFFGGGESYAAFPFVITSARKDAEHERWQITPEGAVAIQRPVIIAAVKAKLKP